jgi:hypothetical protein
MQDHLTVDTTEPTGDKLDEDEPAKLKAGLKTRKLRVTVFREEDGEEVRMQLGVKACYPPKTSEY